MFLLLDDFVFFPGLEESIFVCFVPKVCCSPRCRVLFFRAAPGVEKTQSLPKDDIWLALQHPFHLDQMNIQANKWLY